MSPDEIKIITIIYNFIVGDKKKTIRLSDTKINNKEFVTFYNLQNKLYSFISKDNLNNLYELQRLNFLFNNQLDRVFNYHFDSNYNSIKDKKSNNR